MQRNEKGISVTASYTSGSDEFREDEGRLSGSIQEKMSREVDSINSVFDQYFVSTFG